MHTDVKDWFRRQYYQSYMSARLEVDSFTFLYGKVEVRAKTYWNWLWPGNE
jgi:beta-glucanase (GH16 family)